MDESSKVLEKNEKVVYNSKPEYLPYIITSLLGTLVLTLLIVLIFIFMIPSFYLAVSFGILVFLLGVIISNMAYNRTHYTITNKRILVQSGIIGRDFKSIDYVRIQNVSVNVGILGVIFKTGTIDIFTGELETTGSGEHGTSVQSKYTKLSNITQPYYILKILQEHLSKRKEKLIR